MTNTDTTALVKRAQQGDLQAFDRLVRQFHRVAIGAGIAWLGDAELARDLLYSAVTLPDGSIALGTIQGGVYLLNRDGAALVLDLLNRGSLGFDDD